MISFKGFMSASHCQERSVSPEKLTNYNGRIHFYPIKEKRKIYETNQQKLDVTVCSKKKCQTYKLDDFKFKIGENI